jgi:hypothetical protein
MKMNEALISPYPTLSQALTILEVGLNDFHITMDVE